MKIYLLLALTVAVGTGFGCSKGSNNPPTAIPIVTASTFNGAWNLTSQTCDGSSTLISGIVRVMTLMGNTESISDSVNGCLVKTTYDLVYTGSSFMETQNSPTECDRSTCAANFVFEKMPIPFICPASYPMNLGAKKYFAINGNKLNLMTYFGDGKFCMDTYTRQ